VDGYTLQLIDSTGVINATLYDNLAFNFMRDMAPIAGILSVPNILMVHSSVPARNVPEFIAYAKANPRKLNVASAGTGTSPTRSEPVLLEDTKTCSDPRDRLVCGPQSSRDSDLTKLGLWGRRHGLRDVADVS
jgi:hypothetical protein